MRQYVDSIKFVLENGERKSNRTGIDTISYFGLSNRYDLREGFPMMTTRKMYWKIVVHELLWMLSGSTNNNDLEKHKVTIWREWADENGDLGPIYGKQLVRWEKFVPDYENEEMSGFGSMITPYKVEYINQVQNCIDLIKKDPSSRRIIISAWNVADLPDMKLQPCHVLSQFNVSGNYLDLSMTQRSVDKILGEPYNIAFYSLLLSMVAKECGLVPRYFHHHQNDAHIYTNHIEGFKTQSSRCPMDLPKLVIDDGISFWDLKAGNLRLENYKSHDPIKFEVAV